MTWVELAGLAQSPVTSTVVSGVVALIVGLGGGGTIVALLRVSADKGKVVIEAAQGAVIVQSSVIDELLAELKRMSVKVADLERENDDLRARVGRVERNGGGHA